MALTDPVIFNNNPLDIDPNLLKNRKYRVWNSFQSFLKRESITNPNTGEVLPFINNPILNGRALGKPISDAAIQKFNNALLPGVSPIDTLDIFAIQKFHNITDPSVIVGDDWVGSQTSQMYYPTPVVYKKETPQQKKLGKFISQPISDYTEFNSTEGYIAVTWGNKRYVIDAKKEADHATGKLPGLTTPESEFILYNPEIHEAGLRKGTYEEKIGNDGVLKRTGKILKYIPPNWNTWGQETTVSPSAVNVNNTTVQNNKVNNTFQTQTKLTNLLLGK